MTVHFIGAGPGAADLITVRGRDLLARCPVCLYAGSIVPAELLQYCPADARKVDTAPLSLDEIELEYVAAHRAGHDVARLHSGDLSVWSAVAEQVRRLRTAGHPLHADAGRALLRGRSGGARPRADDPGGRAEPGADARVRPRLRDAAGETLAAFGRTGATLAIHLAIHALPQIVAELTPLYGGDCPVAIVVRASWPDERIVRGTLATIEAEVAAEPIERTALILVGRALTAEDFRESALYDPAYQRRFRGRDA